MQQAWWQRLAAAIEREYDRRIRTASRVESYGLQAHGEQDEAEQAEITNVPKGTPVRRSGRPSA
jgi:hypothetical protein